MASLVEAFLCARGVRRAVCGVRRAGCAACGVVCAGSAEIIRVAVFGRDAEGHIKDRFSFPSNKLVITNIDIQSVRRRPPPPPPYPTPSHYPTPSQPTHPPDSLRVTRPAMLAWLIFTRPA